MYTGSRLQVLEIVLRLTCEWKFSWYDLRQRRRWKLSGQNIRRYRNEIKLVYDNIQHISIGECSFAGSLINDVHTWMRWVTVGLSHHHLGQWWLFSGDWLIVGLRRRKKAIQTQRFCNKERSVGVDVLLGPVLGRLKYSGQCANPWRSFQRPRPWICPVLRLTHTVGANGCRVGVLWRSVFFASDASS